MVKLEIEGVTYHVPESWDDITLGKWEGLGIDQAKDPRSRAALIARICDIPETELMRWPVGVFNMLVAWTSFLFEESGPDPTNTVEVDGVVYMIQIDRELTFGEWVDADECQKAGVDVISNLLSVVCRPAGEEYDDRLCEARKEMFSALPMSKVLGLMAFFLECKRAYDTRTNAYSRASEALALLPPKIASLLEDGGGTGLSRLWRAIRFWRSIRSQRSPSKRSLRSCNTRKTAGSRKTRRGH